METNCVCLLRTLENMTSYPYHSHQLAGTHTCRLPGDGGRNCFWREERPRETVEYSGKVGFLDFCSHLYEIPCAIMREIHNPGSTSIPIEL